MQITKVFNPCPCDELRVLSDTYSGQVLKEIDLTLQIQQGYIKGIKTVFIDNTANADDFEILVDDSNQKLVCPKFKQGYFEVVTGSGKFFVKGKGNADMQNVGLHFLNYSVSTGVY